MSATWTPWRGMPSICSATSLRYAPWGNARAPLPSRNIAPVESFRFTRIFTKRCWSNRRSRDQLFGVMQNRQAQPDQRTAAFTVFNNHLRPVAVEHFQPFGDIGHSDAAASKTIRMHEQLSRSHTHAVIFHLDHQARLDHTAAQG